MNLVVIFLLYSLALCGNLMGANIDESNVEQHIDEETTEEARKELFALKLSDIYDENGKRRVPPTTPKPAPVQVTKKHGKIPKIKPVPKKNDETPAVPLHGCYQPGERCTWPHGYKCCGVEYRCFKTGSNGPALYWNDGICKDYRLGRWIKAIEEFFKKAELANRM